MYNKPAIPIGKPETSASSSALILLSSLLHWRDDAGKSLLHATADHPNNFTVAALLLSRLQQLPPLESHTSKKQWLMLREEISGYTPLHMAIYKRDLKSILLLLRHASALPDSLDTTTDILLPPRMTIRPMECLRTTPLHPSKTAVLTKLLSARDHEQFTPGQLLAALQVSELKRCRLQCVYQPVIDSAAALDMPPRGRRSSFDDQNDGSDAEEGVDANEFQVLGQDAPVAAAANMAPLPTSSNDKFHYSCEVFAFGKADPCALGVGQAPEQVRPQRVQAFAQSHITDGAVHVAAAAHHTLVVTAAGHLYAFGLGKAGRLGTGNDCNVPVPARVLGLLTKKHVVAAAAAENHSLCVTRDGQVFAWGSNRFGQLSAAGAVSSSAGPGASGDISRSVPRRVDDLKNVFCVAVAAGSRHSVALSQQGEVYAWGDNTAGQLALGRRNGVQKVQRVEALWGKASSRKRVAAVAASDHATLVLVMPSGNGIPVNVIYSWGHGSHVPTRVHFDESSRATQGSRPINPVAIACAKYHNVAISSDGMVYTWGLHAEPLGTAARCASSQPQLVTGMLPENNGGHAVAVSASENHTAVITQTGALYTWGDTIGKDVLGHAGVRWQEEPKCVAGVYRAVGVAAAREHTILLIGTSFPPLPARDESSLEALAIRTVAEHLDVFNILPSLIVAERTASMALIEYCTAFVRHNLDGIINVAQRSVLDCYLNEQLMSCVLSEKEDRDSLFHPLLSDVVRAGIRSLDVDEWLSDCDALLQSKGAQLFIKKYSGTYLNESFLGPKSRFRSSSECVPDAVEGCQSPVSTRSRACSVRCSLLTTTMDLSTKDSSEAEKERIAKELRSVRKKLSQIDAIEKDGMARNLTDDQLEKVSRRSQLDADLQLLEPALRLVEQKLRDLVVTAGNDAEASHLETGETGKGLRTTLPVSDESPSVQKFVCLLCGVKCSDGSSYASHMTGRKHRNKLAQCENDETKQAATLVMKDQVHRGFLDSPSRPMQAALPTSWGKPSPTCLPKYNLPGPPHGIPTSFAASPTGAMSLREIIEEEAMKSPTKKMTAKITSPYPRSTSYFPAGPVDTAFSTSGPKPLRALGDFVKRLPPVLSKSPVLAKPPASWKLPEEVSPVFTDIQKQQEDFKDREDKSTVANTKWFVQERQRAESLKDIQLQHQREEAQRLYVAEQIQIERQIMEELAMSKKASQAGGKRKQPRKGALCGRHAKQTLDRLDKPKSGMDLDKKAAVSRQGKRRKSSDDKQRSPG
jgi:alpha-tubulin suppressor-like RCC1 family protein